MTMTYHLNLACTPPKSSILHHQNHSGPVKASPSSASSSSSSSLSNSNRSLRSSSGDRLSLLSRSSSLQSTSSSLHSNLPPTSFVPSCNRASPTCSNFFPPSPPQSHYNTPPSQRCQPRRNNSNPSQPTPPPARTASRNDIFSLSLPQPSPLLSSGFKQPSLPQTISPPIQPSYDSRDLKRLKASLQLRISSSHSAVLGQGTHGTVHLALCGNTLPDHHHEDQPASTARGAPHPPHQSKPWQLCAAKVSNDISGSVKEALVLERLRPKGLNTAHRAAHPSNLILGWLGLKEENECEWIRTVEQAFKQRKRSSSQSYIPPIILVLEYCPGGDLFKFVQRALGVRWEDHPEDNRLLVDQRRWLSWSREITQALAWCKECNVLVGDLKPHNILLTSQLGIRLSDFNCSTIHSTEKGKHGSELIDPQGTGTSVYAAPELVRPPPSPYSYPADIFALGVTMYFLITGREPFCGVQSAVERMLLISRGAFWEHETAIRWRMLEDGHSLSRPASKSKQTHPVKLSSSISSELQQYQSSQPIVSSDTIEALFGVRVDIESDIQDFPPCVSASVPCDDDTSRFQFYNDGSPKIRHLDGNEFVDERIMKLISQMCSPLASDRPSIDQIDQELKSL